MQIVKLITEEVQDVQFITEETEGKKDYKIRGIFLQSDIKNRNGRVYGKDILMKEVKTSGFFFGISMNNFNATEIPGGSPLQHASTAAAAFTCNISGHLATDLGGLPAANLGEPAMSRLVHPAALIEVRGATAHAPLHEIAQVTLASSSPSFAPRGRGWFAKVSTGRSGGTWKRRLIIFGISALATGAVMTYLSLTRWFSDPSIGIVVYSALAIGIAFGVTAVSTGLQNRRALYVALGIAGAGIALYYPMMTSLLNGMTLGLFVVYAVATVLVCGAVGWFLGGADRGPVVRTAALTGVLVAAFIALEKYMQYWEAYSNSSRIRGRPIATVGASTPGLGGNFWVQGIDLFTHLLLPTIAIILVSFASYTRYSRASLLEVMNQDYIRTAKAKGLTQRTVVVRHAFRNALIPITTIIAFDVGAIVGGAVITETVFGWTGMGRLFVDGLNAVDPNPVMAFFVVTGALAVLFNLVADLVYAALDPRIKVG